MTGTTPAEIEEFVAQAWDDILAEFAGCLGEPLDEDTLAELEKLFDNTIRNAIENHGVAWEEPIRSYALRHVCQIAKATRRCGNRQEMAVCLPEVAQRIMAHAHRTCKRLARRSGWAGGSPRAGKIGVLCGGSATDM